MGFCLLEAKILAKQYPDLGAGARGSLSGTSGDLKGCKWYGDCAAVEGAGGDVGSTAQSQDTENVGLSLSGPAGVPVRVRMRTLSLTLPLQ